MKIDRRDFMLSSASASLALFAASTTLAQAANAAATGTTPRVRRRYVRVGSRNIHYMTAGEGSPVVLIHGSPGDSSFFNEELPELATKYAVYAFDSPGFGRSEPPPLEERDVAFLADRIAGAMRALKLPPAVIYGFHTGAAVAMEIAARQPDVVRALMLDGVPMFNDQELSTWFPEFFLPMVPDKLGGQFTSFWTRCRDQGIWFPWSYKKPEHAMRQGVEATAEIQDIMRRIVQPARTYVPTFRSAVHYGPRVQGILSKITQPTVILCAEGDVLAGHLDRLPPLRSNQSIKLVATAEEVHANRDQLLLQFAGTARAPSIATAVPVPLDAGVNAHVLELPDGREIFMRVAGKTNLPPLLLIHDAPGTSHMHLPLIEALSAHARVYAVDLPGCGESAPFATTSPTTADYAETLRSVMVALGLKRAAVYGIGFGSSVALDLATRHPKMVDSVVLQSVLLPSAQERQDLAQNYAPAIELKADGSHWYATWLMLRDSVAFWPWYNTSPDALRSAYSADAFDADRLHDRTVEVMKRYGSYQHVINAALSQDALLLLGQLKSKTVLCTDVTHPFSVYDETLVKSRPDSLTLQARGVEHVAQLARMIGI
ncbi:alpha/beta hydrolase [Povalibacter sp.]|uniref:alpha/beta hydrolase n=1 Tax=Povalibacter sp. TaxID=1962978 RepID=UPI002F3E29E7